MYLNDNAPSHFLQAAMLRKRTALAEVKMDAGSKICH